MNTQKIGTGSKMIGKPAGSSGRWVGAGLALAATAAIAIAVYVAAPRAQKPVASVANTVAQSVPDAAMQGVDGYLKAHAVDRTFHTPQTSNYSLPTTGAQIGSDVASQGVAAYLAAHGVGETTAPDAALRAQREAARASRSGPAIAGQSVPDAASQGVASYLAAHGEYSYITAQSVPDAASQGVASYLAAHGENSYLTAPVAGLFHGSICEQVPDPANCSAQAIPGIVP